MKKKQISDPILFLASKKFEEISPGKWEFLIPSIGTGKSFFRFSVAKSGEEWEYFISFERKGSRENCVSLPAKKYQNFHSGYFASLSFIHKLARNFSLQLKDEELWKDEDFVSV